LAAPANRALAVAFSPDGRLLATGGLDRQVQLWDVATGRILRSLAGHRGPVETLAFAPDGKSLASGSSDTTVLVWSVPGADARRGPGLGPGEWEAAWRALAGADAAGAYRAVASLGATPACAAFLRERLRPVAAPEPGRVRRLLADLDSDRFAVRERASRELAAMGELVRAPLEKALAGQPSREARRRLEQLLEKLGGPGHHPQALRGPRALPGLQRLRP